MSGMKIIKPTSIEDSMLISSSVPEPDTGEVVWNAATNYAVEFQVIRTTTHMKYERKVAGVSATPPENDPINWLPIGPTNRHGMLDRKVGTATTATGSISTVIQPGAVGGLGALELVGREAVVTYKDAPGGTTVYSRTVDLDGTIITSVYEWFFNEFDQLTDFVLTDLPQHYTNGELSVEINNTPSDAVSIGVLHVGKVLDVGKTLYGGSVSIIDYSKKTPDKFGNMDVLERAYSKRSSIQIITEPAEFNKIFRGIASLRAIPCIYIGADIVGYEPMINYGFFKDFSIVIAYPTYHLCNLEIEGLT